MVKQTVGLDAEFYKGAETLMFPPHWLDNSERVHRNLPDRKIGKAMGIDPAEGGDKTTWSIIDDDGLIYLLSMQTPDTSMIVTKTIELMNAFHVPAEKVCFDRGGGGKQHADQMIAAGYRVKTVHFGEAASTEKRPARFTFKQRVDSEQSKTVYKNRRAEMYGRLRELLDPTTSKIVRPKVRSMLEEQSTKGINLNDPNPDQVFALPENYFEIRQQLTPIPLLYDGEGVMYLPPKYKRNRRDTMQTLTELIGHSPDEVDSLVLAVHILKGKDVRNVIKVMV
jgi:hypothetical protein